MTDRSPDQTALTKMERDLVQRIADRDGITLEEAATNLFKTALARKVKKRTGKLPAKVYSLRKR